MSSAVATKHIRRNSKFKVITLAKQVFSLRGITIILLISFAVLMATKSAYYMDSTRKGLHLYAVAVLPSLFPFYFCSLMLTKIGAANILSKLFEAPMKKLYHTPKESAYIMFLSVLSGYPVGASCTKELYDSCALSSEDAKTIAAFASTSGPIFMLGTVGSAIFNNVYVGIIIAISHYIAAFLNGFIYRKRKKPCELSQEKASIQNTRTDECHIDSILSESVSKSTLSMLTLGGYIVLAGLVVDTLSLIGLDTLFFTVLGSAAQPFVALVFGFVEMTRGCIECSKCNFKPLGVAMATAIISFGGLSVMFQNYSFLSKCKMKFSEVLTRKITQSLIAFALAIIFALILKKFL